CFSKRTPSVLTEPVQQPLASCPHARRRYPFPDLHSRCRSAFDEPPHCRGCPRGSGGRWHPRLRERRHDPWQHLQLEQRLDRNLLLLLDLIDLTDIEQPLELELIRAAGIVRVGQLIV